MRTKETFSKLGRYLHQHSSDAKLAGQGYDYSDGPIICVLIVWQRHSISDTRAVRSTEFLDTRGSHLSCLVAVCGALRYLLT